jgi:hypothetical protein
MKVSKALQKLDYVIACARYEEDLSWLIPFAPNVSIQNKGELSTVPKELQPFCSQIPNIGLDQFCHLNYIIENYDNLPQITIFAQANLQDHYDIYEPFLSLSHVKYVDECHPYAKELSSHQLIIELLKQVYFHGFTTNARAYLRNDNMWYTLNYVFVGNHDDKVIPIRLGDWFKKYVGENMPEPENMVWFKNAIFGVSKAHILSRPKNYYERLRNTMTKKKENILHYLERSWYYILNLDKQLHPFTLESIMKRYINIFKILDINYMKDTSQSMKHPRFFLAPNELKYHEEYVHKQINMYHYAKNANSILQVGFNTGHMLALMMLANPSSKVMVIDDFKSPAAKRNYDYLRATFGPHRFVDKDQPNDKLKFDLMHFDNEQTLINDLTTYRKFALKKTIIFIDDYEQDCIQEHVQTLQRDKVIKQFNCILADHEGKTYHFVCKYML